MENNKGQTIFLSVVGIATLLVAIVGATFAYFSISVQGNETASSIVVKTAIVGGVTFVDGNDINVVEIYPGWSATKYFTIANATEGATDQISYAIELVQKANTLTGSNDGGTGLGHALQPGEFTYTLASTGIHGAETLGTSNDGELVNQNTTKVDVPAIDVTGGITQVGNTGTLNGTDTHKYTFTITFDETASPQDYAQGKTFAAVLQVKLSEGAGRRTYDANDPKGWTTYPAN